MKDLSLFYNDSKTKNNSRELIIKSALSLFIYNGINQVTMTDIAKACSITTRNLYRYYESKEFIVIDCAYYDFFQYFNKSTYKTTFLQTGLEELDEFLKTMIIQNGINSQGFNHTKFIMYFDIYIITLDKSHPAFIKYTKEYVPNINSIIQPYLSSILKHGINDGSINIKTSEIKLYNEYLLQSLFSILMRVTIKESENSAINIKLAYKHIEIILDHLGANNGKQD